MMEIEIQVTDVVPLVLSSQVGNVLLLPWLSQYAIVNVETISSKQQIQKHVMTATAMQETDVQHYVK